MTLNYCLLPLKSPEDRELKIRIKIIHFGYSYTKHSCPVSKTENSRMLEMGVGVSLLRNSGPWLCILASLGVHTLLKHRWAIKSQLSIRGKHVSMNHVRLSSVACSSNLKLWWLQLTCSGVILRKQKQHHLHTSYRHTVGRGFLASVFQQWRQDEDPPASLGSPGHFC